MQTNSSGERPEIILNKGVSFSRVDISTLARYSLSTKFMSLKSSVLDVGCGYGHGVFLQSLWAKKVYGLDIDQKALDIAKEILNKHNIRNIELGVKPKILSKFRKFDLITAYEVLEHLEKNDGTALITELHSHLNYDGVFIVSTPYIDLRGKTYWKHHKHEYYFGELKRILLRTYKHVKAYYQVGDGSLITPNVLSALLGDPTTPDATLIFICSNEPILEARGNFVYNILRGGYRNIKYLTNF